MPVTGIESARMRTPSCRATCSETKLEPLHPVSKMKGLVRPFMVTSTSNCSPRPTARMAAGTETSCAGRRTVVAGHALKASIQRAIASKVEREGSAAGSSSRISPMRRAAPA